MSEFFNGGIKYIKVLIGYKWNREFFARLTPKGNEIIVPTEISKGIKKSIIYLFISSLLSQIVLTIVYSTLLSFYKIDIISIISSLLGPVIVYAVLVYFLTGNRKINAWPYYIIMYLCLAGILSTLLSSMGLIRIVSTRPLDAVIRLLGYYISFIGLTIFASCCIDFCLKADSLYNKSGSKKDFGKTLENKIKNRDRR